MLSSTDFQQNVKPGQQPVSLPVQVYQRAAQRFWLTVLRWRRITACVTLLLAVVWDWHGKRMSLK
jgi:hypothetical protein